MAIMTMRKTEITEDKIQFYFSILEKANKVMFSFKELNKLFNTSSNLSPVKKNFLESVVSLSSSTGSSVTISIS
jgi:hypothetical protein